MRDFIRDIASPYWWLGVVAVGISINLASAYLKPRLDAFMGSISKTWATRTENRKAAFAARVEAVRNSEHEQAMVAYEDIRNLVWGVFLILFGLQLSAFGLLAIVSGDVTFGAIVAFIGLALWLFGSYVMFFDESRAVLREARKASKTGTPGHSSGELP